jgi:acyl-CoA synthetase (AMP-forming)/AMP-acid ligase II
MVSPGHWGAPDRTGPLETRDLGYFDDDGRLIVVGRIDEVIISGGENIHPAEVEATLEAHPAVLAACVFGVPDELWGERLEAAVVLADGSPETIEADLRSTLPGFQIPKRWHVLDELPLGPTGKVDRKRAMELTAEPEPTDAEQPGSMTP